MTKIVFFYGKPLFTFASPLCPICVGSNPFGCYIQMDMTAFPKQPRLIRCLVAIAGPIAIFLLAALILNFGRAGSLFFRGFSEFVLGALSPTAHARPLIIRFFQIAGQSPLIAFGILAAKFATASMIPFPQIAGGRFLAELFNIDLTTNRLQRIQTFCLLIALPVVFAWGSALIRSLFAA
jgi:hypothetical protein